MNTVREFKGNYCTFKKNFRFSVTFCNPHTFYIPMNQNEYNTCVKMYADHLYRFVLKNLHQEETSKDIVQNAFVVMWQKREEVEFDKAKAYLFTVGYRKMIDEIRKGNKTKLVENMPESWSVYSDTRQTDLKKILHQALETLPEIQKLLVLRKDYEG